MSVEQAESGVAVYLVPYFSDIADMEGEEAPSDPPSLRGLAAYVDELPETDSRLVEAEELLEPFFDEPLYEGFLMYPASLAAEFIFEGPLSGNPDTDLSSFVTRLREDRDTYLELVADRAEFERNFREMLVANMGADKADKYIREAPDEWQKQADAVDD